MMDIWCETGELLRATIIEIDTLFFGPYQYFIFFQLNHFLYPVFGYIQILLLANIDAVHGPAFIIIAENDILTSKQYTSFNAEGRINTIVSSRREIMIIAII